VVVGASKYGNGVYLHIAKLIHYLGYAILPVELAGLATK